jgi:hypothetical protein
VPKGERFGVKGTPNGTSTSTLPPTGLGSMLAYVHAADCRARQCDTPDRPDEPKPSKTLFI